jgi:hypothetical protein
MQKIQDGPNGQLTLHLLRWVSENPRTYGEAMEAWRTSCPRLTIWEDAIRDGLIQLDPRGSMRETRVNLTPSGKALLNGHSQG